MTGLPGGARGAAAAGGTVRPPALAGSWYPDSPAILLATARNLLRQAAAAPVPAGRPVALVVPHAGWAYSGVVAATAYRLLAPGAFARVVVVAPSHHGAFDGYALDDAPAYRTPLGEIPLVAGGRRGAEGPGARARRLRGDRARSTPSRSSCRSCRPSSGASPSSRSSSGGSTPPPRRPSPCGWRCSTTGRPSSSSRPTSRTTARGSSTRRSGRRSAAHAKIRALDAAAIDLLCRVDADGFRAFVKEKDATICGRSGLGTMLELLARIAPKAKGTLLAHWASGEMPGSRDDSSVDYAALAYTREGGAAGPALTRRRPRWRRSTPPPRRFRSRSDGRSCAWRGARSRRTSRATRRASTRPCASSATPRRPRACRPSS